MDNKKKYLMIGVIVLAVVLLISGGTYAFIVWSTNETQATNVVFTVTPDYTCGADAGGHITSSDRMLAPTDCMDPEYAIQRTITTSSTTTGDKVISMDLWLNVNHVDTNLLNSSNFKYAITKNKNSCTSGVINSGVINEDIQDNKINLLEGVEYATLNDTYYLYIWLDEAETNTNTMNQSFDLSIDGQCNDNGLEKTRMVNFTLTNTSAYFKETDYKTKITEIHFVYDKDLPEGVIENQVSGKSPYQLSTNANKPIYGYLNQIDDTDTYKLYITSKYKIFSGTLNKAFANMSALQTITFDNFDTSGNTTMNWMLAGCSGLTNFDVKNFSTLNVTNMNSAFYNCKKLTSLDLGYFDTSRVNDMQQMFMNCYALTSLDVTSFNTSIVTKMNSMFREMDNIVELDLSSFDTSLVNNMNYMFESGNKLETIYVSNLWNIDAVTTSTGMFQSDTKLPNFNSSVIDKTNAHYGSGGYLTYKAHN